MGVSHLESNPRSESRNRRAGAEPALPTIVKHAYICSPSYVRNTDDRFTEGVMQGMF